MHINGEKKDKKNKINKINEKKLKKDGKIMKIFAWLQLKTLSHVKGKSKTEKNAKDCQKLYYKM